MVNYNLIGISGKQGSGKDTFYDLFNKHCSNSYKIAKFADKLKQISALLTGHPLEHFYDRNYYSAYLIEWGMDIRTFQQRLGTEGLRQGLHENTWVLALFSNYNKKSKWIITDVRFPNEAAAIKERNGIIIRIERPGDNIDQHPSETSLDDYKNFDFKIINDGNLKQLEMKIKKLFYEYWHLKYIDNIPIIL